MYCYRQSIVGTGLNVCVAEWWACCMDVACVCACLWLWLLAAWVHVVNFGYSFFSHWNEGIGVTLRVCSTGAILVSHYMPIGDILFLVILLCLIICVGLRLSLIECLLCVCVSFDSFYGYWSLVVDHRHGETAINPVVGKDIFVLQFEHWVVGNGSIS